MVIKQKIGNLNSYDIAGRSVDFLPIDWFEADKRILHKRTQSGKEVVAKFLNEPQSLVDGDILWIDETSAVVVDIQPCETIVIHSETMYTMATICYEIGNKHLPLFIDSNDILIPFDAPLMRLLQASGHNPKTENRKLVNRLKTTVSPHGDSGNRQSLFSKILQLTTPA